MAPARGLTILGTDTEVGKTRVATLLIRQLVVQGHRVGAYKPVASGVTSGATDSDARELHRAAQLSCPLDRVCPQSFLAPLAPPVAAAREGRQVDEQLLVSGAAWWQDHCDCLVVESAGGALSPVGPQTTVLDIAQAFGYPVVLVAAHRLGMMNHVLLSLEAIRRRELSVAALVVNQVQPARDNSVQVDESLACLLPFCGKIDCYGLDYQGSTLFPLP